MGFTTIVEFNNDRFDEIERDEKGFVDSVLVAIRSGEKGSVPGGEVVCVFHRSGKIYEAWIKFKKKWF